VTLANAILDLLYPPRCAACREPLGSCAEEPFCPVCREAVDEAGPGCAVCALPGPLPVCGACLADPPAFAAVLAGALLGGPVADAVHALKYRDRPALARPLGRWLASRAALPPGAAVASVPLARGRRVARGYDQAALLADHLARCAGLPRLRGVLRRTRETPPQVGRTRAERAGNVAGAFAAGPAAAGREVVLVDDVVTTGATADACARALRAAGATRVVVAALARAE
jgi:ComF family protein